MIEQRVEHRSLNGWRGVALIAAIAAAVVLGSSLFTWLGRFIGSTASLLFILYGCGIAWFLLYRYVMSFAYACNGNCLRVARRYGRYERHMVDIWLNGVSGCGTLEEMRRRFPSARVQRAVKPECSIEPLAVAFYNDGRTEIALLQPNDALRAVLLNAARRKG